MYIYIGFSQLAMFDDTLGGTQGFLISTDQATSAHEELQAAGVLLHFSTHSVGQRQDLMSRSAPGQN